MKAIRSSTISSARSGTEPFMRCVGSRFHSSSTRCGCSAVGGKADQSDSATSNSPESTCVRMTCAAEISFAQETYSQRELAPPDGCVSLPPFERTSVLALPHFEAFGGEAADDGSEAGASSSGTELWKLPPLLKRAMRAASAFLMASLLVSVNSTRSCSRSRSSFAHALASRDASTTARASKDEACACSCPTGTLGGGSRHLATTTSPVMRRTSPPQLWIVSAIVSKISWSCLSSEPLSSGRSIMPCNPLRRRQR